MNANKLHMFQLLQGYQILQIYSTSAWIQRVIYPHLYFKENIVSPQSTPYFWGGLFL